MAYFVSAKGPCQGLYLFAVLPWYSRKKWRFHHQLCLSAFHFCSLKNQILRALWLKWGVWRRGAAPSPWPCSPSLPAACRASLGVPWWIFLFHQGPSATWGLHICGRNTVHGPFEVVFINIQFPLTQRATRQSSPSWSCMPNNLQIKTPPMCISTMGPALSGMGL